MDISAMSRASERAADAARRAEQLYVRIERLRSRVSLTGADVLFGQQAAERAFGRALRAERDFRHARESTRTAYRAAAGAELAVAALHRARGSLTAADDHDRRATELELLAVVAMVEPWPTLDDPDDSPGPASRRQQALEAHDLPAREVPRLRSHQVELLDVSELAGLRHQLRTFLESVAMSPSLVEEVVLAVVEVASNGIRHGRPPVRVAVHREHDRVECAVTDQGMGLDWVAATDRPDVDVAAEGGFGLRLAQAMCDELTTSSAPEGFVVRLVKRL